jgi:hypothetical protein
MTRQPAGDSALAGSMGAALFEGLIVAEAIKVSTMLGRRPEVYFWRSHDGLEIDLLVPLPDGLLPVEIKLTATPTLAHTGPLERFKRLAAGKSTREGVLVCRVAEPRPLPSGNLALPWQAFPAWLKKRLTRVGT